MCVEVVGGRIVYRICLVIKKAVKMVTIYFFVPCLYIMCVYDYLRVNYRSIPYFTLLLAYRYC